jgi:ABC-2 type transport system ATP-binding protein
MSAVTVEDVVKRYRGRGRYRPPSIRRSLRGALDRGAGLDGDGIDGDRTDADTSAATAGSPAQSAGTATEDVVALDGVSLAIEHGEFRGLLGPNGSGKTTLFRLIAGLERPTSGTVSRPDASVGYSFQRPCFFEDLTVRENLRVFHRLLDDPPDWSWTEELIGGLRLDPADHRVAGDLSAGFATKLDLALALLGRPSVLLLDEPFADVDDYSRRRIRSFLADYRTDDRTIVVSTHNVEAFAPVLDRVTILLDGTLRYDGEPAADALGQYRELLE